MFDKKETHKSYGMVGLSRVSGNAGAMFGSSVRHHNFIRLRVSTGARYRDISHYWYHAQEQIVELDLSPTQFADMLTCMNVGDGVPCTLRYVNGREMPPCPPIDQREIYAREFKADMRKISEKTARLAEEAEAILNKPTILKSDRESLRGQFRSLVQDITENLPYVQRSFDEAMDRTVTEAKGDVEAFIQHKIISLGIEALRNQIEDGKVELIESPVKQIESKTGVAGE